jgi:hypothetical protein
MSGEGWRNINQVSEANALCYISSTVLEPFGYTGMPTLVRTDLDAVIDHELRALITRSNKLHIPTTLMCIFLRSKATYLGASIARAKYFPDDMLLETKSGNMKKKWTPSHYVVDYKVAGQTFSSYIDSSI